MRCRKCRLDFSSKINILRHRANGTCPRIIIHALQCPFCTKAYPRRNLLQHVRICKKSYLHPRKLESTLRRESGARGANNNSGSAGSGARGANNGSGSVGSGARGASSDTGNASSGSGMSIGFNGSSTSGACSSFGGNGSSGGANSGASSSSGGSGSSGATSGSSAPAQAVQAVVPAPIQPCRLMPRGEALIVYGGAETESEEDEPPSRRALLKKVLQLPRTGTGDVITLE